MAKSKQARVVAEVRADSLAVGDVLDMAVGPSEVVALYASRGGVETVVRAADSESEGAGTRVLWFWAHQGVRRLRASGRPPDCLGPRPARGAVAKRRAVA
jgi:hypothetical protein